MNSETKHAKYAIYPAKTGPKGGMFFYTHCCGNIMYNTRGKMAYDGKLCPRCYSREHGYKKVTLHYEGD